MWTAWCLVRLRLYTHLIFWKLLHTSKTSRLVSCASRYSIVHDTLDLNITALKQKYSVRIDLGIYCGRALQYCYFWSSPFPYFRSIDIIICLLNSSFLHLINISSIVGSATSTSGNAFIRTYRMRSKIRLYLFFLSALKYW